MIKQKKERIQQKKQERKILCYGKKIAGLDIGAERKKAISKYGEYICKGQRTNQRIQLRTKFYRVKRMV